MINRARYSVIPAPAGILILDKPGLDSARMTFLARPSFWRRVQNPNSQDDGDFLPALKHLRENGKQVLVLARGPRTAKEIRRFAGSAFLDFEYLHTYLEFKERERR